MRLNSAHPGTGWLFIPCSSGYGNLFPLRKRRSSNFKALHLVLEKLRHRGFRINGVSGWNLNNTNCDKLQLMPDTKCVTKNCSNLRLTVTPERIHFLKFILEGYDGMATLSTLDPVTGAVVIRFPPELHDDVLALLQSLKVEINLNFPNHDQIQHDET